MKKEERHCCKNCEYRDYGKDWNGNNYYVIASERCPYWVNIKGNNVKEWFYQCQYWKKKETFDFLKHKEGDVIYVIDRLACKTKTKPILKTKIHKIDPTSIIAPYSIKLKIKDEDDELHTVTYAVKENEMYGSYEEAYKAYHDELVDSLWKLDDEYKNKNLNIIDKINYLEEYKEKRND